MDNAETVETRHARVSNDQLKVARVLRDSGDGRAPVPRDLNVVTGGLQRLRQHIEDEGVVIGAKNAEGLRLDHFSSAFIPWGSGEVDSIKPSHACCLYLIRLFAKATSVMPAPNRTRQ